MEVEFASSEANTNSHLTHQVYLPFIEPLKEFLHVSLIGKLCCSFIRMLPA